MEHDIEVQNQKEQSLAAIFSVADAGIIVKDRNGVICDWNIGAQNILGYTAEEIINLTTKDYAPADSYDEIDQISARLLQGEHIAHVDVVRKHKDGTLVDCSASYTPILDDNAHVTGSVAIFHDISEKKIAEQKAENLAAIFAIADAGIILKNRDGIILDWNIGAQNILGYTPEEIVGGTTKGYAPIEGYEEIDHIGERLLQGEHIAHVDVVRKHKDGRLIDCSASYTPIRDDKDNITGSVAIFHDISEKKAIEKRHKALENTLSNLFDNLSNSFCLYEIVMLDDGREDLKIIMANQAFLDFLNLPKESVVGRLFTEICSGIQSYLPNYLFTAKTGSSRTHEGYNYDLKKHLTEVVFSPALGQVASIITDRTHLVEAEEALKERENDLSLLFSSMTTGFCLGRIIRNEQGEPVDVLFEMVNAAYESLENFGTSSVQGKRLFELHPDGDAAYFSIYADIATTRGKTTFKKYIPSTNVTLDVVCYSPSENCFVCLENDISERIRAEEELLQAYNDTASILNVMPVPLCVISKDTFQVLDGNTAFINLCHVEGESALLGMPLTRYLAPTPDSSEAQFLQKIQENQNTLCLIHHRNGSTIEAEAIARPFIYKDQDAYAVQCIDLTRQKMQEKILRDAAMASEDASKMKSSFLANMSHEIRTPMNGVIGFAELALDEETITDKVRGYLDKIKLSASGLLEIINDILDISKIEAGAVEIEKVPFHLHDIFESCKAISTPKSAEKNIELYFYSEPLIERKLVGDPTKLRQILLNLLSNAIKFTNFGMVKLMTLVEEPSPGVAVIHFEIKDSGIGMTPEQIEKIFVPFMQADSSTTRKYGGTGLGLSITNNLIELMGGKLKVESLLGLGSRFTFSLTFDTIEDLDYGVIKEYKAITALKKPTFKGDILVCEDNSINQQVIREHLLRVGLTPTIAANGKLGVELIKARMKSGNPFVLVLMDIHMPVMDGLEATQHIHALGSKVPIVALTANAMTKDRDDYLRRGMSDYISKPFVAQELWACLLKYLAPEDFVLIENQPKPSVVSQSADALDSHDPIIDRTLGIERAAGDETLYTRIQANFVKENRHFMDDFSAVLASGDILLAHRMAHTLKGVAGIVGATGLAKAAHTIELALSDGKPAHTDAQLLALRQALNAVFEVLPVLEEETDTTSQPSGTLDVEAALALLNRLVPMLKESNAACVDQTDEIKTVLAPIGEQCGMLVSQIEDFDFRPAYKTAQRIKESLEESNE